MRKNKNNKKGFTLIELLVVIVVLAIVMVLATTTVLPLMNSMRRSAFADEAIGAADAAATYITMSQFGGLSTISSSSLTADTDYFTYTEGSKHKYCVTLKALGVYNLYSDKNPDKVVPSTNNGNNPEYVGKVVILTDDASSSYTYKVVMHNASYAINEIGTNYTGDNVVGYSTSQTGWDCKNEAKSVSSLAKETW